MICFQSCLYFTQGLFRKLYLKEKSEKLKNELPAPEAESLEASLARSTVDKTDESNYHYT